MDQLVCPGCGEAVMIQGLKAGSRIDCSNCANLSFELTGCEGSLRMVEIRKVSCPVCDETLEVPRTLKAGDKMTCCGREFQLTYEFGAYALS